MNKSKWAVLLSATMVSLVSCAAQFPFIASEMQSETLDLKAICDKQVLASTEKKVADSISAIGAGLLNKGKKEAAYVLFDRANVYYRIALTNAAIAQKEKEIAKQEQALSKTREDVTAYKQVLNELTTREQQ